MSIITVTITIIIQVFALLRLSSRNCNYYDYNAANITIITIIIIQVCALLR